MCIVNRHAILVCPMPSNAMFLLTTLLMTTLHIHVHVCSLHTIINTYTQIIYGTLKTLCVDVRVWSVTIGTGGIGLHQTCVNRDVLGGGEGGEGGESGVML